ncbi:hypothetical protein BRADI_1g19165v3 [Brachypodium distachyon]|uniref:Uncharacterized protein n=1 Tax=Brachypodium distachyon TaxID=15368 RepID=A0A0Q3JAG7_BRADI|nr:hypothetical protein BRADI_1g19165v3 [Brachypodium distachyon]
MLHPRGTGARQRKARARRRRSDRVEVELGGERQRRLAAVEPRDGVPGLLVGAGRSEGGEDQGAERADGVPVGRPAVLHGHAHRQLGAVARDGWLRAARGCRRRADDAGYGYGVATRMGISHAGAGAEGLLRGLTHGGDDETR